MTISRPLATALATALMITACVAPRQRPPEGKAPAAAREVLAPAGPHNAVEAGVSLADDPDWFSLLDLRRAMDVFGASCRVVAKRTDASGLTQTSDWTAACAAAPSPDEVVLDTGPDPIAFFTEHFELVRVGDGRAFATGYYEPEIAGSRTPGPGYTVPIYARPADLVRSTFADGKEGRGRLDPATGQHVLYHDRAAIEAGALGGRGLEIAWAADPVELFFLQIQGSGRLRLPDGGVMRIGYAEQNGREYTAIGRLLRERGLVQSPVTADAIKAWLRANPAEGRALMAENKSYVFFRELTGPGPLGSIGVPVSPRATVAVDPRFVPYGAPVLLSGMSQAEANGLWVAQDTGGAIKGANRFDTFWGAGSEAARIAGGMQARGEALILLPKGSVARARARAGQAGAEAARARAGG